ncbi:mpv17-like protein [Aethina tumida]|uniref:mpv17-like protein n=1 Tax=Aethina tumida TaxID=116153 RepID=UPI00096B0915|nr:mpv17-like protein [Aethina tumida]
MSVFSRFVAFTNRHPIVRGMISYGTIWPTSAIIQQTIAGKTWENYDWMQALRFSLYGGLFTAPTLYGWIRISTLIWPNQNLKTAITKAVIEQMTYGPAALACFFFGMSLLEGKTVDESYEELSKKFLPSYKVAICFWPFLQTINFCYVPEKNRVPYVSMCSLVWCCFLAYMHELRIRNKEIEITKQRALLSN